MMRSNFSHILFNPRLKRGFDFLCIKRKVKKNNLKTKQMNPTKNLEQMLLIGHGALPYQHINLLKDHHFIQHSTLFPGPSSLDLAIGEECYEIKRMIFPKKGQTILSLIKGDMGGKIHKGHVLLPGRKYIIMHDELFNLPRTLYGYANPKSTTGRAFVHARLLADGVSQYDHLPRGWTGRLWSLVIPQLFPISYVPHLDSLSQMRIFRKDARLSELEIQSAQLKYSMMKEENDEPAKSNYFHIRGGEHGYMIFTADCIGVNGIAGYVGKYHKEPLPIGGKTCSDWKKYFEPVKKSRYIELDPLKYYILSTRERISIPPEFAAEVKPIDERMGEFRSHFAGFFDSAFGYDPNNKLEGNTMTLEMRTFEKMVLWHGQPFVSLGFEKMTQIPDALYNQTSGTYKNQIGAKLGKQFKM